MTDPSGLSDCTPEELQAGDCSNDPNHGDGPPSGGSGPTFNDPVNFGGDPWGDDPPCGFSRRGRLKANTGCSGAGGGGSSKPPAPSKTVPQRLACAAKYGQAHSIGAAFGGGAVANFLGGNSVSSLLNIGLAATGNGPSPNLRNVAMSGPFLGVPVNDALRLAGRSTIDGAGSLSGTVRSTVLGGIFNAATESGGIASVAAEGGELAVQGGLTAGEFASGIGLAKFGFDALTVAYGYAFGCSQ